MQQPRILIYNTILTTILTKDVNLNKMSVLEKLIELVASHNCLVCGAEGDIICYGCLTSELPSSISKCYRCHGVTKDFSVCLNCRKNVPLKNVWIATDYQDIGKELIRRFKFERTISASEQIAQKIEEILPILPVETIICHIPTANSRVRIRGYDQAEEIAKCLAKIRGHEHKSLLIRTGTSRQVGATRSDRFKHLQSAFRPNKSLKNIRNPVLLIDDITTTGATIESAAETLKIAGVKNLYAAVFAQPAN